MSFTFGGFDFGTLPAGNYAIQREYPWVSGLGVESLEIPGGERRRFLQVDRPYSTVEFDVILRADSEAELETLRLEVETYLDPSLGPQRLVLSHQPEWYWLATVSEEVLWERLYWNCASGFAYRGSVVFESYGDAARRRVDDDQGIIINGETAIDLDGNTRAWPTFEIEAFLLSTDSVDLVIHRDGKPDQVITIDGPLIPGQVMRLDYDRMQFAVWHGDTKVASLVNRMSTLDRVEITQFDSASVEVGRLGDVVLATNLATNPSFETNLNDVRSTQGPAELVRFTDSNYATSGESSLWATGPSDPTSRTDICLQDTPIPVGEEGWVGYSVDLRPGLTLGTSVIMVLWWYDGETAKQFEYKPQTDSLPGYSFKRVSWVQKIPAGTNAVEPWLSIHGETRDSPPPSGWRIIADSVKIVSAPTHAEAQAAVDAPYWDGDTSDGTDGALYRWTDTPHASTSEKYVIGYDQTGIEATVYPNSRRQ